MIQTFGLTRHYGKYVAVQDVDMQISAGEIFGFLGLNGAGKTTIMRMICGLLRPTAGHSQVGPVEVRTPADAGRLIGILSFVSQEMRFHERATLSDLLRIYATLAQAPLEHGLEFAQQLCVPLDRPCSRLSPGQQRKAQLAIAWLKSPRYLLLDEPTAGLDPQGVAEVRDIVRALQSSGTTIMFSSHILAEIQDLCTSIGILHEGRLHYCGRIAESYTIELSENEALAVAVLHDAGIQARCAPGGIQIDVEKGDLPAVTRRLIDHGLAPGLVQPTRLEQIFNQAIHSSRGEIAS